MNRVIKTSSIAVDSLTNQRPILERSQYAACTLVVGSISLNPMRSSIRRVSTRLFASQKEPSRNLSPLDTALDSTCSANQGDNHHRSPGHRLAIESFKNKLC